MKDLIIKILQLILAWLTGEEEPPIEPPVEPPSGPEYWDERLDEAGVTVELRNGEYELYAAWCTKYGNWDDVPGWAKQWQQDTLGGDHNAYGRTESSDGSDWNAEKFALIWGPGEEQGTVRTPEQNGWANVPIYGGGGKYDWFPFGGDKLIGLNLPGNHHWSFFGVWRKRNSVAEMDYHDMLKRVEGVE